MIAIVKIQTPRLVRMLAEQHDDGRALLVVCHDWAVSSYRAICLDITRADGSELSETERAHVLAILAAHAAEPIT